jgi:hypothetical protein
MTVTIFSWGYAGWGYAADELVRAVDAVEARRGYEPPYFVDVRASRNVRAAGFRGNAFADLLGAGRHLWMRSLGNRPVAPGGAPQVEDPSAARGLLEDALGRARRRQRVIFFCGCPYPRCEGKRACHRDRVSALLVRAARRLGRRVRVVEWPGGKPRHLEWEAPEAVFKGLGRGLWSLPLRGAFDRAGVASLPHGSVVTVRSAGERKHLVCGPAQVTAGEWSLPVFAWYQGAPLGEALRRGREHRARHGLRARRWPGSG